MGTAVKHSASDLVKPSFAIFGIWALCLTLRAERQTECPDVKNYKWRLNPVWHRMHYSCTHMATVGVKGLILQWFYATLSIIVIDVAGCRRCTWVVQAGRVRRLKIVTACCCYRDLTQVHSHVTSSGLTTSTRSDFSLRNLLNWNNWTAFHDEMWRGDRAKLCPTQCLGWGQMSKCSKFYTGIEI